MGFPGCYWLVGGLGHCHGVIPADILLVDFFAVFLHQFHQLVVGVTGDFFSARAIYYLGQLGPPIEFDVGLKSTAIIHICIWRNLGKCLASDGDKGLRHWQGGR